MSLFEKIFTLLLPALSAEPQLLPTTFDRFVKLNTFSQRTRLGLSICKNSIEKLGGQIGIDSESGRGSTVWFRIQLTHTAEAI